MGLGNKKKMKKNVGFLSFRVSGTDGVSLETKKWAKVLARNNCEVSFCAGELDTDPGRSMIIPEAHFGTPEMRATYTQAFTGGGRSADLTRDLHTYREIIKERLYAYLEAFHIDILIPENVLTIPLNPPFAMALTEVIAETGLHVIAHHHDFFWERKRFLVNCIWDILNSCYPPHLPSVRHVVINSSQANQLALRTGISSTIIPNVMDFENPPPEVDEYAATVRADLGIEDDELLVLQPTRVVQRKGIEHAIELVARLKRKAVLVISHASGDEGYQYQHRVREYAALLGTRTIFVSDQIGDERGTTEDGRKIYRLEDVYPHADLVTYPSLQEGFGNAFLEAIYFRKPLLVNNYSIYSHDIKPLGFDVIEMDNFISNETIRVTNDVLENPQRVADMVEHNYELALRYFSYRVLESKLWYIVQSMYGVSPRGVW